MRYIDIIRTILRNASEKDIPALTWDEQRTHLNKMLKALPSAEPVQGEWIEGETFYFCGEQQFPMTCSVCGRTALNEPWHYCPNCGAKMGGDDNE